MLFEKTPGEQVQFFCLINIEKKRHSLTSAGSRHDIHVNDKSCARGACKR